MDHLAILTPSLGFLQKILNGQKVIESRWYKSKLNWDKIHPGDTIYFKNSGQDVTAKAQVENVVQYADLTPNQIEKILTENYSKIGIEKDQLNSFIDLHKNKKYAILINIKNQQLIKPFKINKSGFGAMSAWITVNNINQIAIN